MSVTIEALAVVLGTSTTVHGGCQTLWAGARWPGQLGLLSGRLLDPFAYARTTPARCGGGAGDLASTPALRQALQVWTAGARLSRA